MGTDGPEEAKRDARFEQLRSDMDTACGLLAQSHQTLKDRYSEFEALLDAPDRSLPAVRQAQLVVRAAGMRSMGLTTNYLASLNAYMKTLDSTASLH